MEFSSFTNIISKLTTSKLGGRTSQFKLAPELRLQFDDKLIQSKNPRKAAVLCLFYPDKKNNLRFLLTERADYNGTHAKQISFPGGKSEKEEPHEKTALRETYEEIGILASDILILRQLSDIYIPPSNFLVFPFIGVINHTPDFKPNYEVASLLEIKLEDLLDDNNLSSKVIETSYMKQVDVPIFRFQKHIIWGATAMILSEVKDLLKSIL